MANELRDQLISYYHHHYGSHHEILFDEDQEVANDLLTSTANEVLRLHMCQEKMYYISTGPGAPQRLWQLFREGYEWAEEQLQTEHSL
ncbi:hypothetical protein H2203_003829 [Taxawa tesnikishii (nom. ined.)]|nr:hypothetical protein H2203_003829 [Dothideales sp. JES 119]